MNSSFKKITDHNKTTEAKDKLDYLYFKKAVFYRRLINQFEVHLALFDTGACDDDFDRFADAP